MRAIGFPTFRYKLVCFVISGALCGLAGALLANHTKLHQPGDDALDALGRSHRHGGARRSRLAVRAGDRRGDFPAAARRGCRA